MWITNLLFITFRCFSCISCSTDTKTKTNIKRILTDRIIKEYELDDFIIWGSISYDLMIHFRCPDYVYTTLRATAKQNIQKDGILATRLCTHKEDVNEINEYHLQKLNGKIHCQHKHYITNSKFKIHFIFLVKFWFFLWFKGR